MRTAVALGAAGRPGPSARAGAPVGPRPRPQAPPRGPATRSASHTRVPTPSREVMLAFPPWRLAIVSTRGSPSPEPGSARALSARPSSRKTSPISRSGTPMPVSATSIVTMPLSSRPRTSIAPPAGVYLAALDTTL